ncbi:alpha-actinin-actin cross linking [Pelomyxa schiedti]|nr:alpha-actinin-actin cross linking [Pelomyxa schiedti]
MLHDYEERAHALKHHMKEQIKALSTKAPGDTYAEIRANIAEFKEYKIQQKRKWVSELADLESLFSNIQSKLKSMGRPPYVPPEDIAPSALDHEMEELTAVERKYRGSLNSQMRLTLDNLRKAFADPANQFFTDLQKYITALSQPIEGDLEPAVHKFQNLEKEFVAELESRLPVIKEAEDQLAVLV